MLLSQLFFPRQVWELLDNEGFETEGQKFPQEICICMKSLFNQIVGGTRAFIRSLFMTHREQRLIPRCVLPEKDKQKQIQKKNTEIPESTISVEGY